MVVGASTMTTVFPHLSACSRRSAGPKEDIMIVCLLNNESHLRAGGKYGIYSNRFGVNSQYRPP